MARVAIVFEDVADGTRKGVMIKMAILDGDPKDPTDALRKAATTMQALMAATKSANVENMVDSGGVAARLTAITGISADARPAPRTPAAPLRRAPRGHRP